MNDADTWLLVTASAGSSTVGQHVRRVADTLRPVRLHLTLLVRVNVHTLYNAQTDTSLDH